jgi:4-hydroxybenzoate polyprenyltransferase
LQRGRFASSVDDTCMAILRELRLSYAFIRRDLSSAFVPAIFFTAAALKATSASNLADLLVAMGRATLYFWLYTYTFCLSNQIVGVEEDRLNKPDRPIPAGLTSRSDAFVRWVVASVAFTLLGFWFGVAIWALSWQAVSIAHNFLNLSKHWVLKCLFMSAGIVAQLAAAWAMVAPLTSLAWTWIVVLGLLVFPTVSLQDLRDQAGDHRLGRRTLPLVAGERFTRNLLSVCFALQPLVVHFELLAPFDGSLAVFCEAVIAVSSLFIAARILLYRDPAADHATYLLYTGWYCLLMICAVALF